jgi:hypothetical protein
MSTIFGARRGVRPTDWGAALRWFVITGALFAVILPVALAQENSPQPTYAEGRRDTLIYCVGIACLAVFAILLWRRLSRGNRQAPSSFHSPPPSPIDHTSNQDKVSLEAPRTKSVFISYRREDSADITGRISDRLIQKFGRDGVFKDVDSIPLGLDFRKHLHDAVSRCDALIVVIGRDWCDAKTTDGKRRLEDPRDHLRIEVEAALQRDIPVIPVLVQGATVPPEDLLPESIRSLAYRHALSIRPDPDFNADADRLVRGIQAHLDTVKRG